ncbi:hypothetical protein EC957_012076 [Mortierella hygrophila]|uniref:Uncharacterized protein n=1 Tax=Mortierella hygrophila TaxID=979708 RepID=A0A9P6K3I8_9FUNG|nr:hypothetical protein EC957_012076 [Mortierella hygrophila]
MGFGDRGDRDGRGGGGGGFGGDRGGRGGGRGLDQSRIIGINAHHFLKNNGHIVISIKANCIDSIRRCRHGLVPEKSLNFRSSASSSRSS